MGQTAGFMSESEFSYNRSWDEIEQMLEKAESKLHTHEMGMQKYRQRIKSREFLYHARNFKALQGVVKTLRWTLGDRNISTHLIDNGGHLLSIYDNRRPC